MPCPLVQKKSSSNRLCSRPEENCWENEFSNFFQSHTPSTIKIKGFFYFYFCWRAWSVRTELKRGSLLGNEESDLWVDLLVFELDRWNYQQKFDLGFPETSQSLSSFKQLLFSSFQGDQRKTNQKLVNPLKIWLFIS